MKVKNIPNIRLMREGHRFDSKPFMSGARKARVILDKLALKKAPLDSLAKIYHAGRESRAWVNDPKYGTPFLGGSSILAADLSNLPLISNKKIAKNPRFIIHEGWTLITRSGTVGRIVYARPEMDGMACSEDVMRVVPDPDKIPPGYLYAYLNSKFGVPQVVSGTYGAVIQHIEPKHIKDLPVPRLGEETESRVHDLIAKYSEYISKGQDLYRKATETALKHVLLTDFSSNYWYSARETVFHHPATSKSFRALNHDSRIIKVLDSIVSTAHKSLNELLETPPFRADRFNRHDAEEGYGVNLIGQKEMFRLNWKGRPISKIGLDTHALFPPEGTVLLACIGTLGEFEVYCRAVRVRPLLSKFAVSDNIMQLRINEKAIDPGYVFSLLRSNLYFRMFRSLSVGGKQQVLHEKILSDIPIPLLSTQKMFDIGELVKQADSYTDQACVLEYEAIALVESAIEQNCGIKH